MRLFSALTTGKPSTKPAKRSLAKPVNSPAKDTTATASKPAAEPTKSLAKGATISALTSGKPSTKPAKPPLSKPVNSPAKDTTAATSKPAAEPTKSPVKTATIETAATTSRPPTEELAKPEHTWVVWQDGRGIWVGNLQDFKDAKRPETIVCDVIDRGSLQGAAALHRAIQLGESLRQTYASHMKSWLQYDDVAQRQRIQEWYDRLGDR